MADEWDRFPDAPPVRLAQAPGRTTSLPRTQIPEGMGDWSDNLPRLRGSRSERQIPDSSWNPVDPDMDVPGNTFKPQAPRHGYPSPWTGDPDFRQETRGSPYGVPDRNSRSMRNPDDEVPLSRPDQEFVNIRDPNAELTPEMEQQLRGMPDDAIEGFGYRRVMRHPNNPWRGEVSAEPLEPTDARNAAADREAEFERAVLAARPLGPGARPVRGKALRDRAFDDLHDAQLRTEGAVREPVRNRQFPVGPNGVTVVGKVLGAVGLDESGQRAHTTWSDAVANTARGGGSGFLLDESPDGGAPSVGPYHAAKTLMSPEGQYRPGAEDTEGVDLSNRAAVAVAGSAMAGGAIANRAGLSGAPPRGALGSFLGRGQLEKLAQSGDPAAANAGKTALEALRMAETMEGQGFSHQHIRDVTNAYVGRYAGDLLGGIYKPKEWEGKPGYLMETTNKFSGPTSDVVPNIARMDEAFFDPLLFDASPGLGNISVSWKPNLSGSARNKLDAMKAAGHSAKEIAKELDVPLQELTGAHIDWGSSPPKVRIGVLESDPKGAYLHEIGHYLDAENGLSRGGDTNQVKQQLGLRFMRDMDSIPDPEMKSWYLERQRGKDADENYIVSPEGRALTNKINDRLGRMANALYMRNAAEVRERTISKRGDLSAAEMRQHDPADPRGSYNEAVNRPAQVVSEGQARLAAEKPAHLTSEVEAGLNRKLDEAIRRTQGDVEQSTAGLKANPVLSDPAVRRRIMDMSAQGLSDRDIARVIEKDHGRTTSKDHGRTTSKDQIRKLRKALASGDSVDQMATRDWEEPHWDDMANRGTAFEQSRELPMRSRAARPVPKTALQYNAEELETRIRTIDDNMRKAGKSPDAIADALDREFGLSVDREALNKGVAWWRLPEMNAAQRGIWKNPETMAELERLWKSADKTGMTTGAMAAHMSEFTGQPISQRALIQMAYRNRDRFPSRATVGFPQTWTEPRLIELGRLWAKAQEQGGQKTKAEEGIARELSQSTGQEISPAAVHQIIQRNPERFGTWAKHWRSDEVDALRLERVSALGPTEAAVVLSEMFKREVSPRNVMEARKRNGLLMSKEERIELREKLREKLREEEATRRAEDERMSKVRAGGGLERRPIDPDARAGAGFVLRRWLGGGSSKNTTRAGGLPFGASDDDVEGDHEPQRGATSDRDRRSVGVR